VQGGLVCGVAQAQVDVGSVASAIGVDHGGEDCAMARAFGDTACQLAQQDGFVGGSQPPRRRYRHLILTRTVLAEEGVGSHACRSQCSHQRSAKVALIAEGGESVCALRFSWDAGVHKLLLEAGEDGAGTGTFKPGQGAEQEVSRAVLPGLAGKGKYVREDKVFAVAVAERYVYLSGCIRPENYVSRGSEG
jgi:hypothetical protein